MITRNVLDKDGNVIGSLTLPDNTSEEMWSEKLSVYSFAPPIEVQEDPAITLSRMKVDFGQNLSKEVVIMFGALDATPEELMSMLNDLGPIKALLETGALGTARDMISAVLPNYTTYAPALNYAVDKLNDFESKYGFSVT